MWCAVGAEPAAVGVDQGRRGTANVARQREWGFVARIARVARTGTIYAGEWGCDGASVGASVVGAASVITRVSLAVGIVARTVTLTVKQRFISGNIAVASVTSVASVGCAFSLLGGWSECEPYRSGATVLAVVL